MSQIQKHNKMTVTNNAQEDYWRQKYKINY